MPRPISQSRTDLVDNALAAFWNVGFQAISMGDLVQETGVSRGSIYSDFKGKRELFHACLARYQEVAVTPKFARVEAEGAKLSEIKQFLEDGIASQESFDGPMRGCLVVNTLAQLDPADKETKQYLDFHTTRLTNGFRTVFERENALTGALSDQDVIALAEFTTTSVLGLWSISRKITDADEMRRYADMLMSLISAKLGVECPT
ncbi:transcriptional regulator, TetR family [Parasphingorhabdus marina DSM 22363]|uniref:Transcriptional regulator, TetR family n=1 Tax=Parasphingorhabdus marina DSM 22363 TaxID=1123272 RepID=A0A1N6CM96_9SPHN|nr:TetR/AcrR family transcriptional regulator [Parasphingorhabdus marina]SIN59585.1 transcriptional regulator, TetR family [Parasphingorhabdus marina DSM 22363]